MAAAQRRDVSGTGQLAAFVTPDLHARQHEDLKEHTAKERTGTKVCTPVLHVPYCLYECLLCVDCIRPCPHSPLDCTALSVTPAIGTFCRCYTSPTHTVCIATLNPLLKSVSALLVNCWSKGTDLFWHRLLRASFCPCQ